MRRPIPYESVLRCLVRALGISASLCSGHAPCSEPLSSFAHSVSSLTVFSAPRLRIPRDLYACTIFFLIAGSSLGKLATATCRYLSGSEISTMPLSSSVNDVNTALKAVLGSANRIRLESACSTFQLSSSGRRMQLQSQSVGNHTHVQPSSMSRVIHSIAC